MNAFPLLDVQTTVRRDRELHACIDMAPDPRRVVTGLSLSTTASMAILVGQLERIAATAARFSLAPSNFALFESLQEQLVATGHLPLPTSTEPAKEPVHGEG